MNGHIKIDRKILDWEWYSDRNTKILFLHLLLRANWKDGKFMGIDVPRGSLISSFNRLAKETNMSVREVRTAVGHLKSTGEITCVSGRRFTVFTVNNYERYQSGERTAVHNDSAEKRPEEKGISPNSITELYNGICVSYKKVTKLSEARKKSINARIRQGYTAEDFKRLFELAEESDFLKGANDRNWSADFDWLIKDANIAKVLDGKYNGGKRADKAAKTEKKQNRFDCIPPNERDRLVKRQIIDIENESMDLANADDEDKEVLIKYRLIRG